MVTNQIAAMIALKKCIDYSIKGYLIKVLFPILKVIILVITISLPIHFFMEESILRFFIQVLSCFVTTLVLSYLFALESTERTAICKYAKLLISKFM